MAKRRNIKRDKRGRFAKTGTRTARAKGAVPTKIVAGSIRQNVRAGRVGPGGNYAGVTAGIELKPKRGRSRYYVGVTAGRRISH